MPSDVDLESFDSVLSELANRWNLQAIRVRDCASAEEIGNFERRYGVAIPDDFQQFLSRVGGMKEFFFDEEMCHFNSLAEITPIVTSIPKLSNCDHARDYFILLDHSICAYYWGIRLTNERSNPAPVIFVNEGSIAPGDMVSPTFRDFVSNYLRDWRSIWPK